MKPHIDLSAYCHGGAGFKYDPHRVILERLKWYPMLLYYARDINSKSMGNALGQKAHYQYLQTKDKQLRGWLFIGRRDTRGQLEVSVSFVSSHLFLLKNHLKSHIIFCNALYNFVLYRFFHVLKKD